MKERLNYILKTHSQLLSQGLQSLDRNQRIQIPESLSSEILDDYLIIDEIIPSVNISVAYERFEPYLKDYDVFPFLGILGGSIFCAGISDQNSGVIYYFDFDFGFFRFSESYAEFQDLLTPPLPPEWRNAN